MALFVLQLVITIIHFVCQKKTRTRVVNKATRVHKAFNTVTKVVPVKVPKAELSPPAAREAKAARQDAVIKAWAIHLAVAAQAQEVLSMAAAATATAKRSSYQNFYARYSRAYFFQVNAISHFKLCTDWLLLQFRAQKTESLQTRLKNECIFRIHPIYPPWEDKKIQTHSLTTNGA